MAILLEEVVDVQPQKGKKEITDGRNTTTPPSSQKKKGVQLISSILKSHTDRYMYKHPTQ